MAHFLTLREQWNGTYFKSLLLTFTISLPLPTYFHVKSPNKNQVHRQSLFRSILQHLNSAWP